MRPSRTTSPYLARIVCIQKVYIGHYLLKVRVQVLCYELHVAGAADAGPVFEGDAPPATAAEMEHFYTHLEQVMTDIDFLDTDNPRYLMRRMRRLFIRARPDKNEVNILRGLLTAIDRTRKPGQ